MKVVSVPVSAEMAGLIAKVKRAHDQTMADLEELLTPAGMEMIRQAEAEAARRFIEGGSND
jgi:hypothetical protein